MMSWVVWSDGSQKRNGPCGHASDPDRRGVWQHSFNLLSPEPALTASVGRVYILQMSLYSLLQILVEFVDLTFYEGNKKWEFTRGTESTL